MARKKAKAVVVIGGGFTGAAIAYQLDRLAPGVAPILVIEPRATLGGGLAYSTQDPAHRVNVPASRMSLDPAEPQQFVNWLADTDALRDDPEGRLPDGRAFPRRAVFGRYVGQQLERTLAAGRVEHRIGSAERVDPRSDGYEVTLSTGETLDAAIVVIASTHPSPSAPPLLRRALAGDSRFVADSNAPGALEGVGPRERVLIVGAGLTMADIVASLDLRGHAGPIMAVSRRGQLPGEHPELGTPGFGDFLQEPARTVKQLLRAVRQTVSRAEAAGLPWQSVFDVLRDQGRDIWTALDLDERRKLARRLRPFWDARRFRIAPQVQAVLARRRREGTFDSIAGGIRAARAEPDALTVVIRSRGASVDVSYAFDRIILATGPGHRDILRSQSYLARLEAEGLVALDRVGLGLAVDIRGRALGRDGEPSDTLLIGGPLARGTFGELMGLPEVSRHSVEIAKEIAARLASPVAPTRKREARAAAEA